MDRGTIRLQQGSNSGAPKLQGLFADRDVELESGERARRSPAGSVFDKVLARPADSFDQCQTVHVVEGLNTSVRDEEPNFSAHHGAREGGRVVFLALAASEPLTKRERIGAETLRTIKTHPKTRWDMGFLKRAGWAGHLFLHLWVQLREADEIICSETPSLFPHLAILTAGKSCRLFGDELQKTART